MSDNGHGYEINLLCGDTVTRALRPTVGSYRYCEHCDGRRRVISFRALSPDLRITAVIGSDGKDTGETVYVPVPPKPSMFDDLTEREAEMLNIILLSAAYSTAHEISLIYGTAISAVRPNTYKHFGVLASAHEGVLRDIDSVIAELRTVA